MVSHNDRFGRCLAFVLQQEGGFSDNPSDKGGATNRGVTQATWAAWTQQPVTVDDIRRLTVEQVTPLYAERYWEPTSCDALPDGLDLINFDCAVNQGPGRARTNLQSALNIPADGIIGPQTMLALNGCDPAATISRYRALREAQYRGLAAFPTFGLGWLRRTAAVTAQALAWAAEAKA